MTLRIKKDESEGAVRLQFGSGEFLDRMSIVTENPDKVFAVIGPFDNHGDKPSLEGALTMLLRGFNVEQM